MFIEKLFFFPVFVRRIGLKLKSNNIVGAIPGGHIQTRNKCFRFLINGS